MRALDVDRLRDVMAIFIVSVGEKNCNHNETRMMLGPTALSKAWF